MYFPLVFQVISRSYFVSHLPHPVLCILFYIHVLIGLLLVIILFTVSWVPFTLAVPYSLFIFLVYAPPIRVMPNDWKQSEGSSVPAEVGQTSSEGDSAAVDQVFSMFKDFLEKN